jgi:hypothetical protein
MIFFFVLTILSTAAIVLISLFAPHKLPWYRPSLILTSPIHREVYKQPIIVEGLAELEEESFDISAQEKVAKLEAILLEKNTAIEKLQKQLTAEKSNRADFEKVQNVLNEEIQNLRTQNKELKTRIGEGNA